MARTFDRSPLYILKIENLIFIQYILIEKKKKMKMNGIRM